MKCQSSAAVESLECRRLFAAAPAAAVELTDGVLNVTGSEKRDVIRVSLDAGDPSMIQVVADREVHTFALADVAKISIRTLGGADDISVDENSGRIFLPVNVDAGEGNDRVSTGSGDDVILGGGGRDNITAGAGDDQIDGGGGNDKLAGGDDNDILIAGAGKDTVAGGAGNDNLDGGLGKDKVEPGAGDNSVAVDAANPAEEKRYADLAVSAYTVTPVSSFQIDLQSLLEEAIPGSTAVRVEVAEPLATVYYTFGTDPKVYRCVLDTSGSDVELVSREISLQEVRPSASAAWESINPGTEIRSVTKFSGANYDVRYLSSDGTLTDTTNHDIVWNIEDAADNDANNNGFNDHDE